MVVLNDFNAFERWLIERCHKCGPIDLSDAERKASQDILVAFNSAKRGVLGKQCVCGREGMNVFEIQPIPSWPREKYVLCETCGIIVQAFQDLCNQIVQFENSK